MHGSACKVYRRYAHKRGLAPSFCSRRVRCIEDTPISVAAEGGIRTFSVVGVDTHAATRSVQDRDA